MMPISGRVSSSHGRYRPSAISIPALILVAFYCLAIPSISASVAAFESSVAARSSSSSSRLHRNIASTRALEQQLAAMQDNSAADPQSPNTSFPKQQQLLQRKSIRPGSMRAATVQQGRVPYGEESRRYRRTVFTADDWIEHRNSERIVSNLWGLFFSGIVRQLREELLLVSAVSTAVVILNNSGVAEISLPSLPFQLSSPALGLLLVFRTNASYSRWSEGRTTWARIEANACNIVRMAATFTDLKDVPDSAHRKRAIRRLAQATWLFSRSLMNQLLSAAEDEDDYCREMRAAATTTEATDYDGDGGDDDDASAAKTASAATLLLVERILAAPDRTLAAMTEVSLALDRLPIDEKRRVEVDKSIVILGDCLSTCEKIYSSPVPLVYTRHTARFLSFWMLLLPAALYEPFASEETSGILLFKGFAVIPAVAIVAIFLFGIEELAVALEEPFSILPMQTFCDGVRESCNGIMDWCFESVDLEVAAATASAATADGKQSDSVEELYRRLIPTETARPEP